MAPMVLPEEVPDFQSARRAVHLKVFLPVEFRMEYRVESPVYRCLIQLPLPYANIV